MRKYLEENLPNWYFSGYHLTLISVSILKILSIVIFTAVVTETVTINPVLSTGYFHVAISWIVICDP